ncbi:hypothetical protein [Exiguobacterium alkaliphilum]|uniref:hypothetical protein n=1 Tax=Exiguobacterium alkaliphilum TaxID=1428684 RepID=UPI00403AEA07
MSNESQLSRAQLDALLKNVFALQIPVIEKFMTDLFKQYVSTASTFKQDMDTMKATDWHKQFFGQKAMPHLFIENLGFGASFRHQEQDKIVKIPENMTIVKPDSDAQIEEILQNLDKTMASMPTIKNKGLVKKFYKETLELVCQLGSRTGMMDDFYAKVKGSLTKS